MTGVNQTYVIVFDDHIIKTTYLHHIFHQEITTADSIANCGLYLAFVKAVNGAGESAIPSIILSRSSLMHNNKQWHYNYFFIDAW